MKRTFLYILAALLAASCKNCSVQNNKSEGDKPVITVTIEPLRYFTEAIAGDNFNVISMVPKGSSPETYDPTPQQLVDLAKSKAYFRIGYHSSPFSYAVCVATSPSTPSWLIPAAST